MKILLLIGLLSFSAFAQDVSVKVVAPVKQASFGIGIGSKVELDFKNTNEQKNAIFLGRMVNQDSKAIEYLFLDEKKTRISMIDPASLDNFKKMKTQPIISPIDQLGSTCAAYGLFHFWNQMNTMGFKGAPELSTIMKSDRKRVQFLEQAIENYYIEQKTNLTTTMKNYGKRFGFTCKNNPFTDRKKAAEFLFNKTSEGKPVLIDFNISSDMVTSTYEVTDYETTSKRDARLWLPRKVGQRMKSGHVIVGAAAFLANGRRKILVLDSDWTEPRVWDLDKYVGLKAAVKEMGFHTCN
jgi:hypothetical protein